MEGHLKILSPQALDRGDEKAPTVTAENYADHLESRQKKEIARITADANGNYRAVLPPGDYILDMRGRGPGHVRAKPQVFTGFLVRLSE
jgi:hypothetical protein